MKLFIGCSHTVGYHFVPAQEPGYQVVEYWGENCYPIQWSKQNDEPVIVYASPGAGFYRYPDWIKSMFDRFPITEVYIQSTYWDRFALGLSRAFTYGFEYYSADFWMTEHNHKNKDKIRCFTDEFVRDEAMEIYMKTNGILPEFKGVAINFAAEDKSTVAETQSNLMDDETFRYTKVFYEMFNHIQYRNYMKDISVIDKLCGDKNAKAFVWRMNERQDMPNNFDLYGECSNITFYRESAQSWLKKNKNLDITLKTIDEEHYNEYVHKIIAKEFLPQVFGLEKEIN